MQTPQLYVPSGFKILCGSVYYAIDSTYKWVNTGAEWTPIDLDNSGSPLVIIHGVPFGVDAVSLDCLRGARLVA